MCTKYPEIWNALSASFHPDNVKQKTGYDYVTARTVMNRLDEVLGPENWWDDYTPIEHGTICRLTIRLPDGQVLTKVDSGADSTTLKDAGDADKGGFSDAFKRAAVKFGVFRYGYKDGVVTHAVTPAVAAAPAVRRAITAPPIVATRPAVEAPAQSVKPAAGSEDAQGRGGKSVYGAASAARPKLKGAPKSGMELHYYATDCAIDPNLENWIINTHNPQGYPDRLINWTPADVARALPAIKEHLETVKAARARMKASA